MGLKYKDKYDTVRTVYKSVKDNFNEKIEYSIFYNVIKRFFEILIRDVVERNREVSLPNQMGYVYIEEKPHKRAFHVRVDSKETKKQGKIIKYKVPILDDFYKKLMWIRPNKYRHCKMLPLGYSKRIINKN